MKKFKTFLLSVVLLSTNVFADSYYYKEVPMTYPDGRQDMTITRVYYGDHTEDVRNSMVREGIKKVVVDGVRYEVRIYKLDDGLLINLDDFMKVHRLTYNVTKEEDLETVTVDDKYSFSYNTSSNSIYPPYYTQEKIKEEEVKRNNKKLKMAKDNDGNELRVMVIDGELFIENIKGEGIL